MSPGSAATVTLLPDSPAAADSEIMSRVREGDLALLGELFERHHRRLFHFFLRLVRSRPAAEDLVQEVFVRMLKYRHTFRAESDFAPWMFTLARNAATDRYRARPREIVSAEDTAEPAADLPHPIENLERAEERQRLQRALAALNPEKREILLLARFSELKYDRIAGLLGISEGAVKVRVHRALKDLKQAFLVGGTPGTPGSATTEETA